MAYQFAAPGSSFKISIRTPTCRSRLSLPDPRTHSVAPRERPLLPGATHRHLRLQRALAFRHGSPADEWLSRVPGLRRTCRTRALPRVPNIDLLILNSTGPGTDTPSLVGLIRREHADLAILHIGASRLAGMPSDVPTLAESFMADELLSAVESLMPEPEPAGGTGIVPDGAGADEAGQGEPARGRCVLDGESGAGEPRWPRPSAEVDRRIPERATELPRRGGGAQAEATVRSRVTDCTRVLYQLVGGGKHSCRCQMRQGIRWR